VSGHFIFTFGYINTENSFASQIRRRLRHAHDLTGKLVKVSLVNREIFVVQLLELKNFNTTRYIKRVSIFLL